MRYASTKTKHPKASTEETFEQRQERLSSTRKISKAVEAAPQPSAPADVATNFHGTIDGMLWQLPIEVSDTVAARDVLRDMLPKGTLLEVHFQPCDRVRIKIRFVAIVQGYAPLTREVIVG
jgi:hypothetical protein